MKLSILITLVLALFVFGEKLDANFTTMDVRSSLLPKNSINTKISYNRINDTIDIFNMKATQLGSSNLGSIGDAVGIDMSLGYGINSFLSLFFTHESLNINYIDDMLANSKNELFFKINLLDKNSSIIENISIDFGFINNQGTDIDIKQTSTLNSMFKKIKPNGDFYINDGTFFYNNKPIILLDKYGKKIYPFVKITNMSDNSLYTRAIIGKQINNSHFDIYMGLKATKITSSISLEPKDNDLLQDAIDSLGVLNLNRSEMALFGGFVYLYTFKKYIFESNYEYIKIFKRESDISYINQNHIINATILRKIDKNFHIFIGGKAMINQFNSVMPYLYNKYTKTKYDKKYGYAKIGFVLNFDIM